MKSNIEALKKTKLWMNTQNISFARSTVKKALVENYLDTSMLHITRLRSIAHIAEQISGEEGAVIVAWLSVDLDKCKIPPYQISQFFGHNIRRAVEALRWAEGETFLEVAKRARLEPLARTVAIATCLYALNNNPTAGEVTEYSPALLYLLSNYDL